MRVKIISIDPHAMCQKKDGSTYPGFKVIYENIEKGTIDHKSIHEAALAKDENLRTKLSALKQNDIVNFVYKKEGKFNNLSDITHDTTPTDTKSTTTETKGKKAFTPRDDSVRQRSIVRQNALSHATALFAKTLTTDHTIDIRIANDVIAIAKIFEGYTGEGLE